MGSMLHFSEIKNPPQANSGPRHSSQMLVADQDEHAPRGHDVQSGAEEANRRVAAALEQMPGTERGQSDAELREGILEGHERAAPSGRDHLGDERLHRT